MTKARVLIGLALFLTVTGWVALRPGPRSAAAAPAAYDPFTEDNAAHRFATGQTRHWRHLMTHRH
jgi:hypothetical protein